MADRITKRITRGRSAAGISTAGAGSAGGKASGGRQGRKGGPVRLVPEEVEAKGKELADLIRRNGEELAQNVETVVEKVGELGAVLGAIRLTDSMLDSSIAHIGCNCASGDLEV